MFRWFFWFCCRFIVVYCSRGIEGDHTDQNTASNRDAQKDASQLPDFQLLRSRGFGRGWLTWWPGTGPHPSPTSWQPLLEEDPLHFADLSVRLVREQSTKSLAEACQGKCTWLRPTLEARTKDEQGEDFHNSFKISSKELKQNVNWETAWRQLVCPLSSAHYKGTWKKKLSDNQNQNHTLM